MPTGWSPLCRVCRSACMQMNLLQPSRHPRQHCVPANLNKNPPFSRTKNISLRYIQQKLQWQQASLHLTKTARTTSFFTLNKNFKNRLSVVLPHIQMAGHDVFALFVKRSVFWRTQFCFLSSDFLFWHKTVLRGCMEVRRARSPKLTYRHVKAKGNHVFLSYSCRKK